MEQPSGSSEDNNFNFKELCFICAKPLDKKHKKVITVPNDEEFRDRFIELCRDTSTVDSYNVKRRIESVPSLVGVNAQYHKDCYSILNRVLYPEKFKKESPEYEAALQQVFTFIINSDKHQFFLQDFKDIMENQFRSNEALYHALRQHFQSDISIVQGPGIQPKFLYKKPDIASICVDWHFDKDKISAGAEQTILKVAAGILKRNVMNVKYDHSSYPPANKFLDNVTKDIPSLLSYFLDELIGDESNTEHQINMLKKNSIAHSIINVLKPKSFTSTLQLAIGTYIYRKTGSKLIIDLMSEVGVSASYKAIQLYEASTIINPPEFDAEDSFIQFVFDNTDHNVSTLDGKETFHCLGSIGVYTPSGNVHYRGGTKKLNTMPDASTLAKQKHIRTIPYRPASESNSNEIKYISVSSMDLDSPPFLQRHHSAYLWAKYLQIPDIPSWGGFMDVISSHVDYHVSHVTCLPFINEPPSNLTTLNTSLHHALQETTKQKQRTCFVTYDQPLYLKARSIVLKSSEPNFKNIVVRLSGFHLLMSYLGAIGYIMGGSGLEDLWSLIYAQQSTKKMISGHAYSRAVRAHILTFTALGIMICEAIQLDKEAAKEENEESREKFEHHTERINSVKSAFANWNQQPPLLNNLETNDNIEILTEEFTAYLEKISKNNPTAQLWRQYLESVSVALQFIEAERLGDWQLHLQSVKKMLPLFHASGHFAYAKSAQIYLQNMIELEINMDPIEYDRFTKEGCFTIRRTYKAWSGVWSDMTIEQTLNRFFGTDLKHGRGVTPSVVARYLLGMPAAFDIMENLEQYVNLKSANSEQHTDLLPTRIQKDAKDITTLIDWLRKPERNPFIPRQTLLALSSGIIGTSEINCYKAYEVGENGMATMVDKNLNVLLTKLYKVRNLIDAKSPHIDDTFITIDPLMLFQRISLVIHGDDKKMREAFLYELSPYPLSLFDVHGFMRKTTKSQLYKIFEPLAEADELNRNSLVVVDGGWLLHHIVWPHSRTFGEIFELYYNFLITYYGFNVTVVFDGYYNNIIGVKSYERYRRKEKYIAADICIVEDNINTLTQAKFLSNTANKSKFVEKLMTYLKNKHMNVEVAAEDADCLIVNMALMKSESTNIPITIIGNDVDLLILLVALAPEEKTYYFHKIAGGKSKNMIYSSKDQKEVKQIILFAHAFAGCDSTSAFFKKGKRSIIKLLQSDPELKKQITEFYKPDRTIDDLYPVAENIICRWYSNKKKKPSTMEKLRYDCFKTAVASSKKNISIAALPPTKPVLIEHVKRVYYQVQLWIGKNLNPENWGWKRTTSMLIPLLNTEEPAPASLLQLIQCTCTGDCSTKNCSCQKMGLKCNQLCRQCNGESCMNRQARIIDVADEKSEDKDDPEAYNRDEVENVVGDDEINDILNNEIEEENESESEDEAEEMNEGSDEDENNRTIDDADEKMDVERRSSSGSDI